MKCTYREDKTLIDRAARVNTQVDLGLRRDNFSQ